MRYIASFEKFIEDLKDKRVDEQFVLNDNSKMTFMNSFYLGSNIDKDFTIAEDFCGHILIENLEIGSYVYSFENFNEFIDYCSENCLQKFNLNDKYDIYICPIFEGLSVENKEEGWGFNCFEIEEEDLLKEIEYYESITE